MAQPGFKKVFLSDPLQAQFQSNVESALYPVMKFPILSGHQIDGITITAGTDSVVNHQLGQTLQGYFIVKNSAASQVYDGQSTNAKANQTLILRASANTTVSVWVY